MLSMRSLLGLILLLGPAVALGQSAPQTPASCERLASLSLPNVTITLAEVVRAGAYDRSRSRCARQGDGEHGGARSWLQRWTRNPAVQHIAGLLPCRSDAQ